MDFQKEYNSIVSNKYRPSYIDYKGKRFKTIYVGRNRNIVIWKIEETFWEKSPDGDNYLHNFFSDISSGAMYPLNNNKVKFHKRLKVYSAESGNYINLYGVRIYVGNAEDY